MSRKKGPPEPRDPRGDYYRPVYESDEASPMSHRSPSPSSHLQSHGRSEQSSITVSPRDTPRLLEPVQMQMRPPSRPSPSPQQHEVKHRWLEDDTTESDPKRRRIEPGLDAGPTQHATLSGRGDRAISPKHYITIEPSTSAALPPTDDGSQPSKRKRVPLPPQHQRFLMAKSTKAPAQPPPPVTRAQPPSAPQNDRDREREPAFPRTANQTMGAHRTFTVLAIVRVTHHGVYFPSRLLPFIAFL
ncbi:hypothetical protein BOTBODRAFT_559084 [Botryobasidium botryosum FD-172 SS1]|uniref:Uncharacterized protein n=1 Tax=Botryobasidium botryosum (strain FD-172 SS1) TaxID=930990 RepID=A0A067LZF1_BOTB1|nr:hypothetical protein BOTBODRAFT_559084 [Botryobasidium botryosum FD-172 SS1]